MIIIRYGFKSLGVVNSTQPTYRFISFCSVRSAYHLNGDVNRYVGRALRAFIGVINRFKEAGLKPQPTRAKANFKFIDRCSVGYNPRGFLIINN